MLGPLCSSLLSVLTVPHLIAMVVSTCAGIVVGAIPGLSAAMGVALLIPFTFTMPPLLGLLCMAGMYNGAIYGGSITAILLNIPGTPASVVTSLDGNAMVKNGKARYALETSVISSFVGGILSAISLMLVAPILAKFALRFGPAEIFWISVFGLSTIASFISGSMIKGLLSACLGLFVSTVGIDQITGVARYTFGNAYLVDGFPQIVVLIGLFSIPEVISMLSDVAAGKEAGGVDVKISGDKGQRWTFGRDLISSLGTWIRSSVYGIVIGMIPGAGANIAAFISYNSAKKKSASPETFGKGNVEGIRASDSSNNAVTASAMIPMLTFGIPGNTVTAIMVGGLLVHGLHPGPNLFMKQPEIVYGLMWGMLLTNFVLLAGGYMGSSIFAKCLKIPKILLAVGILVLSTIGTYSINNNMFDVCSMLAFGVLGALMKKVDIPVAPAVLGLILGPIAESELRRALMIADSPAELFTHPLSMFLIAAILFSLFFPVLKKAAGAKERKTI